MVSLYEMGDTRLREILSKFQMPDGKCVIEKNDEFGESELYWILKNQKNNKRYLLVNTYSHPNLEKEMAFYKKNGFNAERPVLRDFITLEKLDDKDDPEWNYLFGMYAVFELK